MMIALIEAAMSELALFAPEYLILCGMPRIEARRPRLICIRDKGTTRFSVTTRG